MQDRSGRRAFIRAGVVGGVALTTLPLACDPGGPAPPSGPIAAGNVADVMVDSLHPIIGERVLLGRDAMGLYAMTAICTHAGCLVGVVPGALALQCPCHGSQFGANGDVTRGPAAAALQHFQVDVDASGAITIQSDVLVLPDQRTPVA